ncbi:acid-sensing ion channel 4-B-like [Dermacentor variabilis]|uniref:acid-sensing ion channel 4-B-like n=1 Tax=Dermacentor variabilis TaxID=34621 RepID=UPI003F5BFC85
MVVSSASSGVEPEARWTIARLRDFVAVSGVPGCDVLCGRRGGGFRRTVWAIVLTTLLSLTLHECIQVFLEYGRFPVSFDYSYEEENSLHFPGVTVCNVNPVKKAALCHSRLPSSQAMPEQLRKRLCENETAFYDPNPEDRASQEQLTTWMAQLSSSRYHRLDTLTTKFEDMIVSCSYGRKNCTNRRFFTPVFMNRYGNCLCFNCNASREEDDFYAYDSTSSPDNGLVLVLDVQPDQYLPTSTEMGFFVMVHGHEYSPDPCSDGDFVEPGYATYIGIHLTKRLSLPEPYEHPCQSDWPPHLEKLIVNDSTYTKEVLSRGGNARVAE